VTSACGGPVLHRSKSSDADPACHSRYVAAEQIVLTSAPQWWEIAAALATTLSALVIAWQAFLTRKSVAASEKAVTVAQAALVESQIARIESGAPRLSVTRVGWFDVAEAKVRFEGKEARLVNVDDVFKLPRDGKVSLGIHIELEVRNEGPGTATLMVGAAVDKNSYGYRMELAPGVSEKTSVFFERPVAEWIALTDEVGDDGSRESKKAGSITVIYCGPRDADLDEVHTMEVRGSLLLPVEDAQGDWRPHHDPFETQSFHVAQSVVTRTYWRSRQAHQTFELSDPS
jgi:hypothetical protein